MAIEFIFTDRFVCDFKAYIYVYLNDHLLLLHVLNCMLAAACNNYIGMYAHHGIYTLARTKQEKKFKFIDMGTSKLRVFTFSTQQPTELNHLCTSIIIHYIMMCSIMISHALMNSQV